MKIAFFLSILMLLVFGCTSEIPDNTCITALDCEEGEICQNGDCVPGKAGDTGNTGNIGDTGDTGNTGDSGNTGNSGDSGDSGDTGDTGDDKDGVDTDSAGVDTDNSDDSDLSDESEQSDQSDDADVDNAPVCGNHVKEDGEDCDSAEINIDPGYSDTQVCNTDCQWNPYCGDSTIDYKQAVFAEDAVILRLDGDSLTEAIDSSPNTLGATIENATRVAGKFGNALNFTGTCAYNETDWVCDNNGRVYWTYDTVLTDNFTMMAWVKAIDEHEIDEEGDTGTVGTKGQRYLFGANHGSELAGAGVSVGTNGISVYEHGDGYMPALAVYEGGLGMGWNHIAVVYDNRQPLIYLNGNLVKTGLKSARATVNAPTSVGAGSYGNFNGTVDEVRVVTKALSEESIREAMGEVCDNGSSNVAVSYGVAECNEECLINAHCGDGFVSNGETCDEGTYNGTAGKCKADCSGYDCIPDVYTFTYTGAVQTFDVQYPGTYTIEAWGAQGMSNAMGVLGGKGGYAVAKVSVTKGDVLNIYVGEGGSVNSAGGWNGGGSAGASGCAAAVGGGGGGASDVRKNGIELTDRILIAGGGGGAGGNRRDGCGAGTGGGGGAGYYGGGGGGAWNANIVATGGSQSYGGSGGSGGIGDSGQPGVLGVGGAGGGCDTGSQSDHDTAAVGGAGGGTTGNNGICAGNFTGGSGAGGSSYIHAAGNTDSSTSANIRSGNGEVVITLTCP